MSGLPITLSSRSQKVLLPWLLILLVVGAVIFFHLWPFPDNKIFWRQVSNFGHIPLFGSLSLIFLWFSSRYWNAETLTREHQYGLALLGVLAIGLVSEILQSFGSRHADLKDFFRDMIGAGCALLFAATYDPALRRHIPFTKRAWRIGTRLITAFYVLVCFLPVVIWFEANRQQMLQVPAINRFESYWDRLFLRTQQATLSFTSTPTAWKGHGNNLVGRLTFHNARYPGLFFLEPYPDWTPYTALTFMVFSPLSQSTRIHIRIQDIHHTNQYSDRFNQSLDIHPGINAIRLPLQAVKFAPAHREMDMAAISSIVVFTTKPPHPFTLYFDDVVLE